MTETVDKATAAQLAQFIERIERIEEEMAACKADRDEIMKEAKGEGYDPKILKAIVASRKKDQNALNEARALFETYMAALSVLADTPLGQWAMAQERASSEARRDATIAAHGARVKSIVTAFDRKMAAAGA